MPPILANLFERVPVFHWKGFSLCFICFHGFFAWCSTGWYNTIILEVLKEIAIFSLFLSSYRWVAVGRSSKQLNENRRVWGLWLWVDNMAINLIAWVSQHWLKTVLLEIRPDTYFYSMTPKLKHYYYYRGATEVLLFKKVSSFCRFPSYIVKCCPILEYFNWIYSNFADSSSKISVWKNGVFDWFSSNFVDLPQKNRFLWEKNAVFDSSSNEPISMRKNRVFDWF